MMPKLDGIDHIHLYVADRAAAEAWYQSVLGFTRVEALMAWAVENGPLTIENPEKTIHLALFEKQDHELQTTAKNMTTMAFGASGEAFLAWKAQLENQGLKLRITDHELAYSLYFTDPWHNLHEITTYERDYVAQHLN